MTHRLPLRAFKNVIPSTDSILVSLSLSSRPLNSTHSLFGWFHCLHTLCIVNLPLYLNDHINRNSVVSGGACAVRYTPIPHMMLMARIYCESFDMEIYGTKVAQLCLQSSDRTTQNQNQTNKTKTSRQAILNFWVVGLRMHAYKFCTIFVLSLRQTIRKFTASK